MTKSSDVIFYEEGSLQENDVIIFVDASNRKDTEFCTKILEKFQIKQELFFEKPIALVGIFGKYDGSIIFENETQIGIDTVLCGHEIQIEANCDSVEITLDHRVINCDGSNGIFIAADESGIKFLSDRNAGDVLDGNRFPPFISFGKERTVDLKEIFDHKIYSEIMHIYEGGQRMVKFGGEAISITVEHYAEYGDGIRIITIENENHVKSQISAYMQKLDELRKLQAGGAVLESFPSGYQVLGMSDKISGVKTLLKKASASNIAIMLTGESGTGKTFLAREIHKSSGKSDGPFVHVNCAAISPTLIESELFGYADGAFTGAKKGGKKGYFEMAQNGTIFLDEIAELPMDLQGRLLEVIQEKTFYRVGGNEKIQINCRLITATNRDLKQRIADRSFREDLYYRINVFPINLPPLRERLDDIQLISSVLLPRICQRLEIEPLMLSPQAIDKMRRYSWPGNIRELENILEKASILCDDKIIFPEHLDIAPCADAGITTDADLGLKERLEMAEKAIILKSLTANNFERIKTAQSLKIGRTNLFEKIRKYNLEGKNDIE
ncbi:MAG TPA: sigma-54 dependent transcriptional regulator [Bacillota bacterium]|nr:sigma-54 dependent transcriptional regulator [Bacillota bacterium]